MSWIKIFILQSIFIIILFLSVDFIFTNFILSNNIYSDKHIPKKQEYRVKDTNFHHSLAKSYKGEGSWEYLSYKFCTDKSGFISNCENVNKLTKHFNIAFIGDSFTEGIGLPYEETFVGMFAGYNQKLTIGNFAVGSYSPTIYLKKIEWLLNNGYTFDHLYLFIDISDVQDEAFYFLNSDGVVDDKSKKIKNSENLIKENFLKKFIKNNFYIFTATYLNLSYYLKLNYFHESFPLFSMERSAWTHNFNVYGYGDLGVSKSIDKALDKTNMLYKLLQSNNIKMSIGVYPWPEQLYQMSKDLSKQSLQSKIWRDFCFEKCENFFDFFPIFRDLIKKNGVKNIYNKYYIPGDVHFNKEGNSVIFNHIKNIKN